jgi:hypothetical protein
MPNISSEKIYLNLVAVYSEGKSDFLEGWTFYAPGNVRTKDLMITPDNLREKIGVRAVAAEPVNSNETLRVAA